MYMILQECSLWKVAEVFFIEPTKVHFVKEISRKVDLAHTSVNKHLSTLLEMGLIKKTKGDIYSGFKATRENEDFIFQKKLDNLIILRESGLTKELSDKYPKNMILFGSFNKGEDIESSDIDLFIDSKKFKINLDKFEKYLNRKIHLIFKEEVSKSLMSSIENGSIVYGER